MELQTAMQRFLRDESGQTTTEYVLILAVVLTIIMQFKKRLFAIVVHLFERLGADVDKTLDDPTMP